MNERAEKFRQQLQKELGLTVGPKDPILAEWLAHDEFREEIAAEHQRMLVAFEEALLKNQASWSESAKNLANQSLNAALGAARENIATLSEEAGRSQAGVVRAAAERGAERLERAAVRLARLSWVTFAAAVIALITTVMLIAERFLH
jgi:NADH dehydrogenase/NADH:ubiquinone oxidoreductase subunit G